MLNPSLVEATLSPTGPLHCCVNGIKCKQLALLLAFDCCFSGQTGGNWFLLRQCDESSRAGMACHSGAFVHLRESRIQSLSLSRAVDLIPIFGRAAVDWPCSGATDDLDAGLGISIRCSHCGGPRESHPQIRNVARGRNRGSSAPAWGFAGNPVQLGRA